jgi:cystathionine beta-lyase/cystathionine gamma-synthase
MTEPLFDPRDELICTGAEDDPTENFGAVLPPIYHASLFRQPDMTSLFHGLANEMDLPVYSRGNNPTVAVLESRLAALERGETCKAFASGMGAIAAVMTGLLDAGDHVLFAGTIYGPTIELAERLRGFGIEHSRCDGDDIEPALQRHTKMIWFESPGSTLFGLLDIAHIVAVAKARGIVTVIDNTVATPLFQKPLAMGVDIAVHTCSKYIGGHSDLVGGAAIGSRALIERVFRRGYMLLGAAMAPMTAYLCLRGLMTMPTRLARHHAHALALAEWLADHPRVRRVRHPTLAGDPLYARQMRAHSGLFAFEVEGGFAEAVAVADRLKLFGKAISWGGPESLVVTGHRGEPTSGSPIPASLLRLSVGFEGVDALKEDLAQALGQ